MSAKVTPGNVPGAPPATPVITIGSFTVKFNPNKDKWDVREDGKFRQDFDNQDAARQFANDELAKKTAKKGKKSRQ